MDECSRAGGPPRRNPFVVRSHRGQRRRRCIERASRTTRRAVRDAVSLDCCALASTAPHRERDPDNRFESPGSTNHDHRPPLKPFVVRSHRGQRRRRCIERASRTTRRAVRDAVSLARCAIASTAPHRERDPDNRFESPGSTNHEHRPPRNSFVVRSHRGQRRRRCIERASRTTRRADRDAVSLARCAVASTAPHRERDSNTRSQQPRKCRP